MTIAIDGSLLDWTQDDRLETSATQVAGYQMYGRVEGDTFYLALLSAEAIGTNTTFWLNTDGNPTTGYQVFDAYGGAEFYINFDIAGVPHLYNGGTGQLVSNISYALSPDHLSLEIALPKSLLGPSVTSLGILADVNDHQFLPGAYASGYYSLTDPSVPSQFDGNLNDWSQSQRLDHGTNVQAGYEVYGKFANDAFVFGVKSAIDIDVGTTFWFNTDGNNSTGYQIFGNTLGAEFNVNIGGDGVARLYSGSAGQTFIGNIDYKIAIDGKSIEFELAKSLIGNGVNTVQMLADISDQKFLPEFYSNQPFTVTDPASIPQPAGDGYKIAIVYSATTAQNYFSETAYSQLFMAAQSQAMAAGIPFDVLSEADLTNANLSTLAGYDAIVFPSFQNVPANYAEIEAVLNDLVFDHHVPLISAGNFMTSDAEGNALPGNAYARMQSLLGVTVNGSATGTVNLIAEDHQITDGYGDGQLIRSYTGFEGGGVGTSFFEAFGSNSSTVIAEQTVNGGTAHNAVIGTVTGGRNVHFATDGFLADNNLLGKALDWVTEDAHDGPQLSLHMTRNESVVASRTDLDQAMETEDVNTGILSSLVNILQQWKTDYNFVGSYYADTGLYPADGQQTNWAVSKPFYDQILAMGNEIGSHSVSHPENTNLLFPDTLTQAVLDQIKAAYADPNIVPNNRPGNFTPYGMREGASQQIIQQLANMSLTEINDRIAAAKLVADPTTLDTVDKALLEATFQFQFETSRHILETQLGITIDGAAVPGMPESHTTSSEILQYYQYLSGGASLVGAGYPGAIGYLTPGENDKVYLAPNMSFDFTLVGWQNLTPEQAAAAWLSEFNALSKNSDMPIVVWPWHDYGPTEWMIDFPTASEYTLAMYTSFIQAAFQAGAEFVTLADLAQRIETFDHTTFSYSVSGNTINATVTPEANSLGTFSLDLDELAGGQKIKSVAGWYAYDEDSVFLDADGGSFQIELGTAQDDVTHITSIGQRAKLVSLTGDGTSLSFTIAGEGKVVVDLKNLPGYGLTVTGASYTQTGEILTLDLGAMGNHVVSVQQTAPTNTAPTDITVQGLTGLLEETATLTKVATLAVVDNDVDPLMRNNTVTVSDTRFLYDANDGGLYLKAGQKVDFETEPTISLTLTATDAGNPALTFSKPLTITVLDGNDGLGVLPTKIVSMERASTDTPLNLSVPADPNGDTQTFIVASLPSLGQILLNGVAIANGQSLTLAEFQSLTYSFPDVAPQDIGLAFQVDDGHGHLDPFNVTLRVTAGVNNTFNGTPDPDRLDGAWGDDKLNGLGGSDILIGGIGADTLDGGIGADAMHGGAGNDKFYVDNAADQIIELAGNGDDIAYTTVNYTLAVGQEVETLSARDAASTGALNLTGNELINKLVGNAGVNALDGGAGNDKLYGLGGNDKYYVDSAGDQVFETTGAGDDTVYTTVSYALLAGQYVETLSAKDVLGTTALNLTGNAFANRLVGNAGNNILNGGAGVDIMEGGGGDDTYVVDNAGDQVIEAANAGTDTVQSSISFALGADFENLTLTGSAAINATGNAIGNTIGGNSGNNTLDGGLGADKMSGGGGNDIYVVDDAGDQAIETAGAGTDTVQSSVSFTLGANVENLTLTGSAAINGTGNTLANVINGNSGDNILNGGAGADIMTGGAGKDTYVVDNAGDSIVETAGADSDTVTASVSYTLTAGAAIETLRTTSDNGTGAINLTGNALAQEIIGNAGANALKDGAGAGDVLRGLDGNDNYLIYSAATTIVEGSTQGAMDRALVNADYTLASGVFVEWLATTRGAGTSSFDLTGNEIAQQVVGNAGANRIDGKGGGDTLTGLAGKDMFVFSSALGLDNVDTITDFSTVDDRIELENGVFTVLTATGVLAASAFRANTTGLSGDADDRVIYESDTGKLFYDADGTGVTAGIHFATLTVGLNLSYADFVVA
jgi:serralysin